MLEDYINIALRSLRHRSLRSWLTLLGIFIGIAAVVSLVSLGDGLRGAITEQFSQAGTDKLTIQAASVGFAPPGSTAVKRLTEKDLNIVRGIKGFKVVSNRLIRSTTVEFNDIQRFGFLVNLPEPPDERKLVIDAMNLEAIEGRLLKSSDNFKVVLGYDYLDKNLFEKDVKLGDKLIINGQDFSIVGFIERSSNPQYNSIIYMNEKVMTSLLNIKDEVDIIIGQVSNVNNIEQVSENTKKELRNSRNVEKGKEDFSVQTPQQSVETFNTVLNMIQSVIVGIAAISLLVGGIGIANTMFTSVLERRKEIGIMKAVGARNNSILTIFLIESGSLGLFGSIIGVILGVSFSKIVEIVGSKLIGEGILQPHFSLVLIIGSLAFGFVVGTLSGIIPARQASLLPPVEALRK